MTTPAPPAETETALARRYRVDIDTGTGTTTWAWLPGIKEFAPKVDQTTQPTTTYDDEGWGDEDATEYKWSAEITMLHRCHPETKQFNAAQEALRLASSNFGTGSKVHVRWYDREGRPEAFEGYALVQWEPDGTATDDLDSVKVTLKGKGKRIPITNPLAPAGG
ncbi:phage tail tube protein [Streptomyces similanensis]|uniref:Phage tail protein n=1 Tax=Streptomyces similanensis TaxID=1274988 RepID=A0ABP9KHJ7_9ACTN